MNIYTIPGIGLGLKLSERSELLFYGHEYRDLPREMSVDVRWHDWSGPEDKVNVSSILEEIFE